MEIQTELLPSDPLSDDEWSELAGLLLRLDSDEALRIERLEGYIAGVLCCPVQQKPSDWFPAVWGDKHAYDSISEDEAMRIINLVLQHYNYVKSCLHDPELDYEPSFAIDPDGAPRWEIWADGFDLAMYVCEKGWMKFNRKNLKSNMAGETVASLMAILDIAMDGTLVPPEEQEELRGLAADLIPALTKSVYQLNRFGKINLAEEDPFNLEGNVPKVGRNEPCPCGSGKKYKKCHGA